MSQSQGTAAKYRIRPGTFFDVPAVSRLYAASFATEPIIDFLFPARRQDPLSFYTSTCRRFRGRYWTLGYSLTVVVDKNNQPVAFSWWKRPVESLSIFQRFLSPTAWVGSLVNAVISIQNYLFPIQGSNPDNAKAFERALAVTEPQVLNTPQRQEAQYLSLLGVDPVLQGEGLGRMLLEDGLRSADQEGSATWLISLAGLERFYARYGFIETLKVKIDELKDWKGGMVMVRE
ncbi:hypothetical protein FSARC_3404 [Fusarium sarcochroum]|uniref:N-acetyltransferase domain-containing protein n=1 Tax=Fusarium sarcochroum TaxID=1208366 RepID=A0A8H4U3R5_9HYPO|nr:hypothetical protein FSARC_3404 [Fusarium sarcochroum]